MENIISSVKVLVLGVGNILRHDDGVGCVIIEKLKAEGLSNLVLIDGGTDGLALLDLLVNYQRAIIIDAVLMGEQPGVVKVFSPEEAILKIKSDTLSTHGIGLAEVLSLQKQLDIKTEIKIIGIQPKDISFGEGLSAEVGQQIPVIMAWFRS